METVAAEKSLPKEKVGAGHGISPAQVALLPDLLALMAYAGTTVLFFWRIVGDGLVPVSYDLLSYFYPYKLLLAEMVHRGELPLWNPFIFMGAPLIANIQAAAFYPPDLLFYLLPVVDALRYSVVLHIYLGAAFTYLFARVSLRLSPASAWVAGAVFGFSGYLGAQVDHLNQLHSAVWLPVLLLCLERSVSRRSLAASAVGGLVVAVQLLAGHTQLTYYSGWALLFFALFLTITSEAHGWNRSVPLASLALMGVLGAAVAGVQLLPTLELATQSYRSGGVPFADAVRFSVQLPDLTDSVLPLYSYVPYVEVIGYTGVVALALLPAALVRRQRPAFQWFFAGLACMALLLAVGNGTRIYGWLYDLVPGFDLFRAPARWLFLFNFSVSILVGMALQNLRSSLPEEHLGRWLGEYSLFFLAGVALLVGLRFWLGGQGKELNLPAPRTVLTWGLFAGAAMALSLAVRAWPHSRILPALLMALLLTELFVAKEPQAYNHPVPRSLFTDARPLYSRLEALSPSRVLSLVREPPSLADEGQLRARLSGTLSKSDLNSYLQFTKMEDALTPDVPMAFGLKSIDGYDGGLLPTGLYAELKRVLVGDQNYKPDLTLQAEASTVPSSRLLGEFGVNYLILGAGLGAWDAGWQEMPSAEADGMKVLRNTQALPRAFVVHSARVFHQNKDQLNALRSLDLRKVAVLGDDISFQPPTGQGSDDVQISRDLGGEVDVSASLGEPGFLVLADSYYPGWKAYVDGREVPLLRADYAVRAVQLGPGQHQVCFVYEPSSFRLGLILSLVGLLATAGCLFLSRRRRSVAQNCNGSDQCHPER